MTKKLVRNHSHWGAFLAEVEDGRVVGVHLEDGRGAFFHALMSGLVGEGGVHEVVGFARKEFQREDAGVGARFGGCAELRDGQ